jgi:hypothetical protein
MKTILQCIKDGKKFLPSLQALVKAAIDAGELTTTLAFIFIKQDENGEDVVSHIISGNDLALWGDSSQLVAGCYSLGFLDALEQT